MRIEEYAPDFMKALLGDELEQFKGEGKTANGVMLGVMAARLQEAAGALLALNAQRYLDKTRKAQLLELAAALLEERQGLASTVLRCDKPLRNPDHPTMKPVELVGRLMKNSSRPEETVLDPFGGSGTTLIAAEELKRRAFLMELDPRFCTVIIRRWEALTGGTATLTK